MCKRIFISYSSNDLHIAESVCSLLEAEGIGCWIAPRDVLPGTIYAEEIIKAIEATDALVLIISRYTEDSVHVRSEVEHAFSKRKVIFPVRLENVELGKALEYFLGSSHWLVAWDVPLEECVGRLAESIGKLIGSREMSGHVPARDDPEGDGANQPATGLDTDSVLERQNILPAQTTSLIGREKETEEVIQLLKRDDVRLVTLTGPGGTGKTRLSIQVASELIHEFEDGVFFIPLAPISDPVMVGSAIAQVLGVVETGIRPVVESLTSYLKKRQMLLVLDNFEQVMPAGPVIAELLAGCPPLKVLTSSREVLHLNGEHELPVLPLTVPEFTREHDRLTDLAPYFEQYSAVRLFIDRAVAAKSDFRINNENAPAIAEICHRLDGLPLAIELAAVRIRIITPEQMLTRLRQKLPLLGRGGLDLPARQRTLEATIGWSYGLLEENEKRLFLEVSTFIGGFTMDAAEVVCAAQDHEAQQIDVFDSLASLVGKSLIRLDNDKVEPRFWVLRTIRDYALKRLGDDESRAIRMRHADYFLSLVEKAEPNLHNSNQVMWITRLNSDLDNLRAALLWFQNQNQEKWIRLIKAIPHFFHIAGRHREGTGWLESAVAAPGLSPETLATISSWLAMLTTHQGDNDRAEYHADIAVRKSREVNDVNVLRFAFLCAGYPAYYDVDRARILFGKCVEMSRSAKADWIGASALRGLAMTEARTGNFGRAEELIEESRVISKSMGDGLLVATSKRYAALIALFRDDYHRVIPLCRESLGITRQIGDRWSISRAMAHIASTTAIYEKKHVRAATLFGIAEVLREAIGAPVPQSEEKFHDAAVSAMREALSSESFDAAWQRGRSMALDRAIDYALSDRA